MSTFRRLKLALLALVSYHSSTGRTLPTIHKGISVANDNSNRIFNSIHHAMRQWGSSLDHNGMSTFVATIPAGTELYHGTSYPHRINDTEWLAFEPEHALVFASHALPPRMRPLTYSHKLTTADEDTWQPPLAEKIPLNQHLAGQQSIMYMDRSRQGQEGQHQPAEYAKAATQEQVADGPIPLSTDNYQYTGYLHTYRTKHDLRLLYVDGQSAAKSDKGTLDVQDIVIRDLIAGPLMSSMRTHSPRPGGPMNEKQRATEMCSLAQHEWRGRIDGILRMEAGFEVILCSFKQHLDLVGINEQESTRDSSPDGSAADHLNYYRAVAARYDGIGGHRVKLDFDNFVSMFAYANATYIDESGLPRVVNDSIVLSQVRRDLTHLAAESGDPSSSFDWQAVTDLIVTRYADRIAYIASGTLEDLKAVRKEIEYALKPFIEHADRNATKESERCAAQFWPSHLGSSSLNVAGMAIWATNVRICQTLARTAELQTYDEAMAAIRELKTWLAWSTWKKCRGCRWNEVCVVPIWPSGSKEEFEHPQCSNMTGTSNGDYWGGLGQPRPGRGHEARL